MCNSWVENGVVRKGRAHYACRECGDDVTMELLYLADCDISLVERIKVHRDTTQEQSTDEQLTIPCAGPE
jgi:transposase-like protein